jgi:O-antigen/teichoic acid export membrane protein
MSEATSTADDIPISAAQQGQSKASVRFLKREGFAVLDQALFYGANFASNIMLARWLGASAYGAFAVGLSIFFLAGALHTAVLTEPMMVFGGRKYANEFDWYIGLLIRYHWVLAGAASIALGGAAFVVERVGPHEMAMGLWGVAAASPFVLLAWFIRPACYVRREAQFAAAGSAVYAVLLMASFYLLEKHSLLTVFSAFLAMGFASLVGAAVTLALLKPQWILVRPAEITRREVYENHWAYGSWNAIATIAQWSSSQILLVLTPMFLNLAAAAAISVVANLMRPLFPIIRSITPLMLPRVTEDIGHPERAKSLRKYVFGWLAISSGASLAYGLGLAVFYGQISHHFFNGKYEGYGDLVLLFGLAYTASAAVQVISVVIRAAGHTRIIALVWGLPGLVTVLISIPIFLTGSLRGVVSVFALSYWLALAIALWKGIGPMMSERGMETTESRSAVG